MSSRRLAPCPTSVLPQLRFALLSLLVLGAPALASAQPEAEGDAPPTTAAAPTPGSSMDAEGADPVASEVADKDAPFIPRSNDKGDDREGRALHPQTRVQLDRPFTLVGDVVFGFGEAPLPGPVNHRAPDATGISVVVAARYGVSENLDLGLDLPWTTASFAASAEGGAIDESSNALGNLMLRLGYDITSERFSIPLRFGVGIPVAQGEADPTSSDRPKLAQSQAQFTADATRGWHDGEYYAVGRMPVTLGGGFEQRGKRHGFSAMETLLLLPKIKGDVETPAGVPGGTTSINSFALRSVTEVAFNYWVIDQAGAGLRGWLVYDAISASEFDADTDVTQPSPLQLALEPQLQGRLDPVTLHLGYILPLGGKLSDGSVSGVRLSAEASF